MPSRWEKILREINQDVLPTEDDPDPLRIDIDLDILRK
jgi:hypothetical protein